MAPHSSTLAWKIPWMEEPGRLQSMGSLRVRYDWTTSLSRIGGGNGNPLQCSCLENPRDGGAWWASVYGVAQSRTRLKRLSSSSSSLFSVHWFTSYWLLSVLTLSCVRLLRPCGLSCQVPPSMEFFRQEYWSGLPFLSQGDLPKPRIEPMTLTSSALAGTLHCSCYLRNPILIFRQGENSKRFCN